MKTTTRFALFIIFPRMLITINAQTDREGSYFIKMPFLKLDGDIIQAIAVPNMLRCCWKCDRLPECLSVNLAHLPNKDGLYECQMLRSETNKCSGLLKTSQDYHHYTRLVSKCSVPRCLNGGRCEDVGYHDFRCHCPQGFTGSLCSVPLRINKWLKTNASPVCFGAKNSSFGSFYIKANGTVTKIKLAHLSGYVVCDARVQKGRSHWGCAPYYSYQDRLMTIITNNINKKILPQDNYIKNTRDLTYRIHGFNSSSPKLVFDNFTTPMVVTAGQEYRIWYGQDLKNYSETNNGGSSCTDVFMYGLF